MPEIKTGGGFAHMPAKPVETPNSMPGMSAAAAAASAALPSGVKVNYGDAAKAERLLKHLQLLQSLETRVKSFVNNPEVS